MSVRARVSRAAWPLAAVAVTLVLALARLLREPRFYFADDTERGSFGQWWRLGEYLQRGELPMLDPSAWQAGNYVAEGQWALLNPVQWAIALGAHHAQDPAVYATVVKLGFLALLPAGVYLLSRSFGAHRPWAALAAVLVPQVGFTVYMDAASWSTGLYNTALMPWVWWGVRRAVEWRRSPVPYLVASYLLITFGYVFGVMILVVILVETLVRHGLRRDGARVIRTLLASAWGGLLTITVYLPALLTSSVTERGEEGVGNVGFLNADLTDMASAGSPWVAATIRAWDGDITPAPLVYIAWVLPLLPLVLPMARSAVRRCVPLLVVGGISLLIILGPSHAGPIRWPLRFIPYLALAAIIVFAVAASRAYPRAVNRRRFLYALLSVAITTVLSFENSPYSWKSVAAALALHLVALVALWWIAARDAWPVRRRTALAVTGSFLVTGAVVLGQLYFTPSSPLPEGAAPDVAAMQRVLPEAEGDTLLLGYVDTARTVPESWRERLLANLWYVGGESVQNLYTVLPHSAYADEFCMDLRGSTCPEATERLWDVDRETGQPILDLMGVSSVGVMKRDAPEPAPAAEGWHLAVEGDFLRLYVRDQPVAPAGGVTWTGEGTAVTTTARSATDVTFTVDAVGEDGRVVLSRLPYPGYSVTGATLAEPLRGWLLTVDVSGARPGDTVTVQFRPPGYALSVVAFALSFAVAATWLIGRVVFTRRIARDRARRAALRARG